MHTRLVAGIIAAFAVSSAVVSAEQQRQHFEVPPKEVAKAEELANQLASSFAQSGSKRSDARGTMRLFHGGPAKAGVSDVWHANFQQFPRLSRLEETRLLLSMDRGPASCAGHAETQDA